MADRAHSEVSLVLLCSSVLALAALALYAPTVTFDFINYDDGDYVTENPNVKGGLSLEGLLWAGTTAHAKNWHPLTWLSHQGDVTLFGLSPGGHHLTSTLLHALNTVLLFLAFHALTGTVWRSAFVAALFCIHPLNVESVAWVSERKNVLSATFWILALLSYAHYVRRPGPTRYAILVLVLAVGLMAKPMLVTLPFVLLLLDAWPLGRTGLLAGSAPTRPLPMGRLILEKIPLFALAFASSVITYLVQDRGGAVKALEDFPLHLRLLNALWAYLAYIGKLLVPTGLSPYYPYLREDLLPWLGLLGGLFVISLSGLAFFMRRAKPWFIVGLLWYLGTLIPVIGIVQVGSQAMADRYAYIPSIGLFIILSWGGSQWMAKMALGKRAGWALAGVPLLLLFLIAYRQVLFWKDSETLFTYALEVTIENPIANNNLGTALLASGGFKEAVPNFLEVLRIEPHHVGGHSNLGYTLERLGNLAGAEAHLREAVRLKPEFLGGHYNLGNLYLKMGDSVRASEAYTKALSIDPRHPGSHSNLGVALVRLGNLEEAARHFEKALAADPAHVQAHLNLGRILLAKQEVPQALAHYRAALELRPEDPEVYLVLGELYAHEGDLPAARRHFKMALAIDPSYGPALERLSELDAHGGGKSPPTRPPPAGGRRGEAPPPAREGQGGGLANPAGKRDGPPPSNLEIPLDPPLKKGEGSTEIPLDSSLKKGVGREDAATYPLFLERGAGGIFTVNAHGEGLAAPAHENLPVRATCCRDTGRGLEASPTEQTPSPVPRRGGARSE